MGITFSVRRFDIGEMREVEVTPQGFLKIPGFATRTGVFPYIDDKGNMRRELRHPDDVFDPESMKTLQYAPVTVEHPPGMVDPSNVKQYSVGHTTERVEVNREMIDVDLIVEDQRGIDYVQKDGIRELSSGYLADIEEEEGTYNGAPYNYRQKNIRYNHLAMVKRGRAGPEVRMRLDSGDAIMRNDGDISVPTSAETSQETAVSDSETKRIVIAGREVEMDQVSADCVQDMMDRFDEMRSKLSELEEQMAKNEKRSDVDISQKNVSPQVKVEQQGPDGKSAGSKVKPGQSTVHPDGDEHGVVGGVHENSAKAKVDEEMDDKKDATEDPEGHEDKDEKEDFEAQPNGQGGGAAMSPFEKLKADYDMLSAKHDEMKAKIDAMANPGLATGEAKPDRQDSFERKLKLRMDAAKLVPVEISKKFAKMSDAEVQKAVIKHKHPKAELDGKSATYLESRFDSIVESHEETASQSREEVGRKMMGLDRKDSIEGEIDPIAARRNMLKQSQDLWKQDLSARKK